MVNTLSGSVSAYRNETIRKRYIRVDDAMSMLDVSKEEALEIALAAGARYQLAKITLIHKERLMEFMKHFTRVPSSNKIVEKKFVRIGEGSMTYSTGVKEITTEPALFDGVLEYKGKYYKVGSSRQEVRDTKTEDESFYLLTLAAVAKELKRRGLWEARVFLAVGLPLTRFGSEKVDFMKYLTAEKDVEFLYENVKYHILIESAAVFPQCYAAVADKLQTFNKKTLIVDIGSWTIDIMPVVDKVPDESKCVTIPKGLITCMRTINEQCVRQLNGELDESFIQDIMRTGRCEIDRKYYDIAKTEIEAFCERVYNSIREYGYNLSTTPIVFVGGGASVMKLFGGISQNNISYITDVKANAKGYEQLAMMGLRKMKKLA